MKYANEIGYKYANEIGYSDINPYEVIRVVTPRCIEIREMNATPDPNWKPEIIPGGFSGHCTNQDSQVWIYSSIPDARVFRIRIHKNGRWYDKNGARYSLSDSPRKFYDYNF